MGGGGGREPSYGQRGETGTHGQHIHPLPCWGRGGQQAGVEMTLCLPHSLSLLRQRPGLGQAWAPDASRKNGPRDLNATRGYVQGKARLEESHLLGGIRKPLWRRGPPSGVVRGEEELDRQTRDQTGSVPVCTRD